MSKEQKIVGAPASNAGDAFHEAWALRQALKLLDLNSGLSHLSVEGIREASDTDNSANWDGVDCALYFDDPEFPENSRIELVQLKYSVASRSKSWTLARFCNSTKKKGNNSLARRLADAFKGASEGKKGDEIRASISVKLVTNQRISSDLEQKIVKASAGKLSVADHKTLKAATSLNDQQLKLFCETLLLLGEEKAREEIREENTLAVAELVQSPVTDMIDGLQLKIQERMGPEASRDITRDTVLSWFKLGRNEGLFPCESKLEPLGSVLERHVCTKLTEVLIDNSIVVFHGKGGCGKTTTAMSLESKLPQGSQVIIYDCYGAGSYRDQSQPRHQSFSAFTQLSNELARATTSPLFYPYQDRDDMAPSFRHKLKTASDIFALENPESLLVFIIDAADNAVSQANSHTPSHTCFVHQILSFTNLPNNVRFVVSSRTSRLDTLKLPADMPDVICPVFDLNETKEFLQLHGLEGDDVSIEGFHLLSQATPRVQSNAVKGVQKLEDAINFLRPNGKSLPDLFRALTQEAFNRGGIAIPRSWLSATLTELSTPVPLKYIAKICDLSASVIEDLAIDLAPNLRTSDLGIEFSNEDFEEFCEDDGSAEITDVRQKIANQLVADRSSSSYAATHLFSALIAAGRKAELGKFLAEKNGTEAISDPVLRRRTDLARLQAALHIASLAQNEISVGETMFIGAEAMRTAGKVEQIIADNADLSATFISETISSLILNDPDERSRQGPVLMQLAAEKARRGKTFESRLNLKAANEWMHEIFGDEENRPEWQTQDKDVVAQLLAYYLNEGWSAVEDDCARWKPKSYGIGLRQKTLVKIALEKGPSEISKILNELKPQFRFLAMNCLSRAGRKPSLKDLKEALKCLSNFDFKVFGEDEAFGLDEPLALELYNEALFFLENIARWEAATSEDIIPVLNSVWPPERVTIANVHLTRPFELDLSLRSTVLRSQLQGKQLDLNKVFSAPTEPDEKNRTPEVQRSYRIASERHEELSQIMPAYVAYAEFSDDPVPPRIENLQQKISSIGNTSGRNWEYGKVRALLSKRATDVLATTQLQVKLRAIFLTAATAQYEGFSSTEAELCSVLLHDPAMHGPVAEILESKALSIKEMIIKATEKSEGLISIARVFLLFSGDDAKNHYTEALKIAEEVDLEALDVLHALCRMVKRERADTPKTRKLVGRFAQLVRFSGNLLESEDGFPQEEAVTALAVANAPIAAMTISRWSDEGFDGHGEDLKRFLQAVLEMGSLDPQQALLLAGISRLHSNSLESKILELAQELPKADCEKISREIINQRILATSPHSEDVTYKNLSTFNDAKSGTAEIMLRLKEITDFKESIEKSCEKVNPEKNNEEFKEPKFNWESVDPLDANAILKAEKADKKAKVYEYEAALKSLRPLVNFSDRVRHLNALAECARSKSFIESEMRAIFDALNEWQGGAIKHWCAVELPKLTVDLGARTLGYSWYYGEQFSEMQSRSGLPPEGRRKVVTKMVEKNALKLGSSSLLKLLAEFACNLEIADADILLSRLLERFEQRLKMKENDIARFDFEERLLPETPQAITASLLYRYLGDIDARVRWRASHAIRQAARIQSIDLIGEVFDVALSKNSSSYTFSNCPFHSLSADLHLAIAFTRVSFDAPELAALFEEKLIKLWEKCRPHILIGHFLSRTLTRARLSGQSIKTTDEKLAKMNGSTAKRGPKLKEDFGAPLDRYNDTGERFSFDSMDVVPYWYNPALRIFADLQSDVLIKTAEKWIVDHWGGHKESNHWVNEPRHRRLNDNDYELYNTRHGSMPTIDRHWMYLQWHGLFAAVGELLQNQVLLEKSDDQYDTFEDWLKIHDTTYPDIWISDALDTVPFLEKYWLLPEPKRVEWVAETNDIKPASEMFAENGSFIIYQHREVHEYAYGKHAAGETVRSKASFVPSKTAKALLRAYADTTDYNDIYMPDHDYFAETSERNEDFRLIPTICHPLRYRSSGIDEQDPNRFGASGIQVAPSAELLSAAEINEQENSTSSWSPDPKGRPLMTYRQWSTMPNDNERALRHKSYAYVDGDRLCIDKELLKQVMEKLDCDLIMTMNFERSIGSDYSERSKKQISKKRVEVIHFTRDGRTETAKGHIGTWT